MNISFRGRGGRADGGDGVEGNVYNSHFPVPLNQKLQHLLLLADRAKFRQIGNKES